MRLRFLFTGIVKNLREFWKVYAIFLVILLLFRSFEAVTASPSFCGSCHFERTHFETWENSTHNLRPEIQAIFGRNVRCVDCHEQHGVWGYVSSKLRGASHFSIQFLHLPWSPRDPNADPKSANAVQTTVPDENCMQCHAAAPFRLSQLGAKDLPKVNEAWMKATGQMMNPEVLQRAMGLAMDHRAHLELQKECIPCHVKGRKEKIKKSVALRSVPENPISCVTCHRDVTHFPIHLHNDGNKYARNIPSEKELCGICHRDQHRCEWEIQRKRQGRPQTFSINDDQACVKCHPNFSVF